MKRIKTRAGFALIIAAALVFGIGVYALRLFNSAHDWAMFQANQSIFHEGVLNKGTVLDRNGTILAAAGDGVYSYAEDESVRRACLHAVGDYGGNFGSGALSVFADKLAGYSLINGTASLDGNGGELWLSIDSQLNVTALNALAGRRGAVLVMDYETGEILCMVSTPTYDPVNPPDVGAPEYEGVYLNRALGATFAPGSVFKLVTLAAAIENISDIYTRSFTCHGSTAVGADSVVCTAYHGEQTIEQALANSCNCAFSELAQELGADTIEAYARQLGLLDSLDISGIASAEGHFDKAAAGTADLSWSAMGQYNDLISPVSMLRFVSAIAGNGLLKEPTLLRKGKSDTTRIISLDTAAKIGEMMSYNVSYSYSAERFPGLKLHAKTGTAEVGGGNSHAWFAGYIEDDEHPLAFTVMIENGGGGLANAAPVANAVLQAAVKD